MMKIITKVKNWKKKIRNFIWYRIGPVETEYEDEMNKYIPKDIMNYNIVIYLAKYKKEYGTWSAISTSYMQERNI